MGVTRDFLDQLEKGLFDDKALAVVCRMFIESVFPELLRKFPDEVIRIIPDGKLQEQFSEKARIWAEQNAAKILAELANCNHLSDPLQTCDINRLREALVVQLMYMASTMIGLAFASLDDNDQ